MACNCGHCNECTGKVGTQYIGELPVDSLDSVADYFLAERDLLDEATGNTVRSIVRVPGGKLFPTANMDNVVALAPNNVDLEIPEGQVRAVTVKNEVSSIIMHYAEKDDVVVMLAVGKLADMVLVQNCGFVNIPNSHKYIIGIQYYLGENGEPTTDPTSGVKLFVPVSRTKLAINL